MDRRALVWACALALAPFGASGEEAERPPRISLEGDFAADLFSNVDGGLREGTRYLDLASLTLAVDGAALGIEGLTLSATGQMNHGGEVTEDLVGAAQGVDNADAPSAARLYELWAEQETRFAALRFGLYDLNSEFDAIEIAGLFLNPSHGIGADYAQSGANGPSIFPVTSLGGRLHVPIGRTSLRFAALDGVPGDPSHPKRTSIRFDEGDGALLAWELDRAWESGLRTGLGAWHYTADTERTRDAVLGTTGSLHRGNTGYYAFAESPLWREVDGEQGVSAYVRVGFANEHVNDFGSYVGAGAVYTGPIPGRDEDQLGFAVACARFSDDYLAAQRALGNDWRTSEIDLELTYRLPVADWLTLQPDVQYVLNPSGDPALRDAIAIGLRLELAAGIHR